ncbi:MAG: histidine phosphatase family protein [Anaerolineaceae bacterium]|nr:histidine phosphatase family protein [Anaerolineaceae bacterium]
MTTLYLVRHGQTDWNLKARYQGHSDIPLNATGLKQAADAVEKINETVFEAIYASDLLRALETAEFFSKKTGLPIQCDERLREINMGKWEGMEISKIQEHYPDLAKNRRNMPVQYAPPGGETAKDLAIRLIEAIDEICEDHPKGPVLIVAHGLSMSTLYCLAKGLDLNTVFDQLFKNAEIRQVEWKSGTVALPI